MPSSDERGTPGYIVEAARDVMGGIYLDPASCFSANRIVQARKYYTKEEDGLAQPWAGRVFLNPPYSRGLCEQFVHKLIEEYERGAVEQAIAVVNVSTGRWFHALLSRFPVVYPKHHPYHSNARIEFYPLPGNERGTNNNSTGQAIFYLGPHVSKFYRVFGEFCTISFGGQVWLTLTEYEPVCMRFDSG